VEPVWTPGAVFALVTSIALGVVAPLSVAAADHRGLPADRVDIVVRGLPPGVPAPVTVTGPGAAPLRRKVVRHQTITLPGRGPYRLLAPPVKLATGTYFATDPVVAVRPQHGSAATAVVNYADLIASSTKVLTVPAGDTVSLTDPPQTASELLVLESDGAPSGAAPGDFLTSGPTAREPDGYLVKVKAPVSAPPGEEEFDVTPAPLPDVLERAEIDVSSDVMRESRPFPFTVPFRCKGRHRAHTVGRRPSF
jgi:hypothetical protein